MALPKADFYSNYRLICSGNSVTFYDKSFNADVTSRTWTFDGGTPATSTEINPVVQFDGVGWHSASLTVANASGSTIKQISNYLYASPSDATLNETYFENFNEEGEVNSNWIFYNKYPDDFEWDWRAGNGYWNTGCIWLNSRYGPDQETDQVISPSFDLSLGNTDNLFFKYCTTSPGATSADYTMSLKLYYSTNCGESWIYFNKITGQDLISSYGGSTNFFPTYPDQWASADFNLPEACKTNNVKFKIEFVYNSYVNNVFIDDFNFVSGYLSTPASETMIVMQVNPDPVQMNENAIVRFNLKETGNVTYSVTDLSGKIIATIPLGNLIAGSHECIINPGIIGLSRGCYFIRINSGNNTASNKFMVL